MTRLTPLIGLTGLWFSLDLYPNGTQMLSRYRVNMVDRVDRDDRVDRFVRVGRVDWVDWIDWVD